MKKNILIAILILFIFIIIYNYLIINNEFKKICNISNNINWCEKFYKKTIIEDNNRDLFNQYTLTWWYISCNSLNLNIDSLYNFNLNIEWYNNINDIFINIDEINIDKISKILNNRYVKNLYLSFKKWTSNDYITEVINKIEFKNLNYLNIDSDNLYYLNIINNKLNETNSLKSLHIFSNEILSNENIKIIKNLKIENLWLSFWKKITITDIEDILINSKYLNEIYIYDIWFYRKKNNEIIFSIN